MEEEEEILVYVEFENFNENNAFSNKNLKLDMIGIDTEHPIMQVNGKFYEGTYEDAVGTYMFFEKENNKLNDDEFESKPNLSYVAKTKKLLKMERIFVTPKSQDNNVVPINIDQCENVNTFEGQEHNEHQKPAANNNDSCLNNNA